MIRFEFVHVFWKPQDGIVKSMCKQTVRTFENRFWLAFWDLDVASDSAWAFRIAFVGVQGCVEVLVKDLGIQASKPHTLSAF